MSRRNAQPAPVYLNGRFLKQPFSGVQRFATEITAALGRRRLISEILVPASGGQAVPPVYREMPCRSVGIGSGHLWEQTSLPIYGSGGVLVNLGNTAPLLARRQIVVIHDCGWASEPSAYSAQFRAFYRLVQSGLVRSRAQIVTVSEFARTEIVRHLGADPKRIAVIPEGGEHILAVAAEPEVLAEQGLSAGRYVLVVGNLVAHKNLRALSKLGDALAARGIVLAIVGAGRDGIFQTQGAEDLPRSARYLGRVSDGGLRALYSHAACFVFPSRYEGFGLPPIEAMACGCPVVASDIPVLREICGDAALFADPSSQDAFVQQVTRVLDEDGIADRLRYAGQQRRSVYNWHRAGALFADIVEKFQRVRTNRPTPLEAEATEMSS